jgi:hypothetical protein
MQPGRAGKDLGQDVDARLGEMLSPSSARHQPVIS